MSNMVHGGALSAEGFSILVVEDDRSMARLLERLLVTNGYQVHIATTVAAARAVVAQTSIDLVILDRLLPDGDGLTLARELKHGANALRIYVLMLSGVSSTRAKVEGFDGGADDYVAKPFAHEELLARIRAGLRIVDLQKALIATNQQLEVISNSDSLTRVFNRRWFDKALEREFAHASRYGRPLSLAVVDIDHFKSVNDTFGHVTGDSVLREVARRIGGTLRKSDSVARLGGEEFAVILPETALFESLQVAEKIRSAVAAHSIDSGLGLVDATISVGVASIPHTDLTRAIELFRFADDALYRAKNRGRNRVELERRTDPWRDRRLPAHGLVAGGTVVDVPRTGRGRSTLTSVSQPMTSSARTTAR